MYSISKKFLSIVIGVILFLPITAEAMNFDKITEIGFVGSPVQSPYHGFIVSGENFNSGNAYIETDNTIRSYTKGVARFGEGEKALFCKYDFNADFNNSISFGGENNYIATLDGKDKKIYKLQNDANLPMYVIYHNYCVTDLKIVGKTKEGKWVNYVDSKKISDAYFNGNDAYKLDGGVMYNPPVCRGDAIIITYYRWTWKGETPTEGEFKLKWDNAAEWFGIEQIIY